MDVPIPLRAHPVPPSVTGQRITPQVTAAQPTSALQQLRRYDYDYSFSAQRAAQDSLSTSQLQNSVLSGGTPLTGPVDALPAALAQYAAVRDGLDQDLALLTQVNPAAPVTVIAAAGDTLATLAQSAAVDVGYLGGVNAFATGLLQAGGTLTVAGQPPVTVTASDTLAGIAARLGTDVGAVATAAAGLPLTTGAAVVRPRPGDRPAWQALQVFTDLAVPVAQAWAARVAPAPAPCPPRASPSRSCPRWRASPRCPGPRPATSCAAARSPPASRPCTCGPTATPRPCTPTTWSSGCAATSRSAAPATPGGGRWPSPAWPSLPPTPPSPRTPPCPCPTSTSSTCSYRTATSSPPRTSGAR